ncbi:unnamed protein product [Brassica napus]|uniref:(rape) hypothetical protein n=1 Tax=Brassica napus TaxID=3708 RepID=A0A816IPK6_BRANA|nr:unnamed protein product [Brassica napus]
MQRSCFPIGRPDDAHSPFKSDCSASGRPRMSDAAANSWESLRCCLIPRRVNYIPIGVETFRFRDHSELLGLANTNTQLPDIVGEITAVKSTFTDPPQNNNRLMATIKMDNDVSVTMSLFDSQAVKLHKQL